MNGSEKKKKKQINKEQTVDYTDNKHYVQFYNDLQKWQIE